MPEFCLFHPIQICTTVKNSIIFPAEVDIYIYKTEESAAY